MKEYIINLSVVVEAEESDFERVSDYAEKLSENLLQDENFAYDGDIKILEVNVNQVENMNVYDTEWKDFEDGDEDEYEYEL